MFVATALLYPCVLAALCSGAGLLVDRFSGRFLPLPLLLTVGAAALIAVSQLTTYVYVLAPATPYVMAAVALAGFLLGGARTRALARGCRQRPWLLALPLLGYALALAPVLIAGRASFSSYMTLADSAVHMIGADFLIRHGQHYAGLDLHNSYGRFINDYYNGSYPSGADTLFGGSAFLLRLPLIWAFQPFNAFVLASASAPAWMLARRLGLDGAWAVVAALSAVLPALVYAYELLGSIKELTALPLILTLGVLTLDHRSWVGRSRGSGIPFALVFAGGISALGLAFGAWGLAAVLVLVGVLASDLRTGAERARGALVSALIALAALIVASWPTWAGLSGSLRLAQSISVTSNPGNLQQPLRAVQVLGVWLRGSYKLAPSGTAGTLTDVLIGVTIAAAVLGLANLVRRRAYAQIAWFLLMLVVWVAVTHWVTTWGAAKTLMLTSPSVVLLAWGGVAALRSMPLRALTGSLAASLALVLIGGAVVSDAMQYHASNLAPTARYEELASLNSRFAGQGPTLFTDFDEWALYELRALDVGGPDFVFPPPALAAAAGGYGQPLELDRVSPKALLGYPLIITRRDPTASRPPSAYRLIWQGSYYQLWRRRPHVAAARVHLALGGSAALQCATIARLAALPSAGARAGAHLIAARAPELVKLRLQRSPHPPAWGHEHGGLVMTTPGRLTAAFQIPSGGLWELWLQGQFMPRIELRLDGRALGSIAGQLSGNSLVVNAAPPRALRLSAGSHRLVMIRSGATLAPGDGGTAVAHAIFLTPLGASGEHTVHIVAARDWRELCGHRYEWVELVGA
jgi:hypothetical protein